MTTSVISQTSSVVHIPSTSWQDRLLDYCRLAQLETPVFQIYSDRRGGRTAWSSKVTIDGHSLSARYWYDGKYINNAKEDVAEVAYCWLVGA